MVAKPAPSALGEPLLDAAAVAAYFGVDATTVYRLAGRAELRAIEIAPRVLRFRPEDVRAFLEERTRESGLPPRARRLLRGRR